MCGETCPESSARSAAVVITVLTAVGPQLEAQAAVRVEATSGTRLDRDRPTRQTIWPGEEPAAPVEDTIITDRDADFVQYVLDEVATRREAEEAFFAGIDLDTGELR